VKILERKLEVTEEAAAEAAKKAAKPAVKPRNYYVDARSVGTKRESEPPRYVRTLSKTEWPQLKDLTWLDFGMDYRMRFEYRDKDLRRDVATLDKPIMQKWRTYLGVHDIVDPFRFYAEFQDSRRFNSKFEDDTRDLNKMELIQAVGELHFKDVFGVDRPLRLQYGRLWMEYLDRRLIANNAWRNTTNTFQGFRAILGQESNDWQADIIAVQPVIRDVNEFDQVDYDQWFYGVIGNWRRWSDIITLQPYFLGLRRTQDGEVNKDISTIALRGYGNIGDSGFDYDFDFAYQTGKLNDLDHHAQMLTTEVGYTFAHDWKPRISTFIGYASGDRDPDDEEDNRFDRLFGFARPWSANDYMAPENIIAPKLRFEFVPHESVLLDMGYSSYWLASGTDSTPGGLYRDPTGDSGTFLGNELDIRARFRFPYVETTLGYAWFAPGEFIKNVGRPDNTNFFYVEITPRLFK